MLEFEAHATIYNIAGFSFGLTWQMPQFNAFPVPGDDCNNNGLKDATTSDIIRAYRGEEDVHRSPPSLMSEDRGCFLLLIRNFTKILLLLKCRFGRYNCRRSDKGA